MASLQEKHAENSYLQAEHSRAADQVQMLLGQLQGREQHAEVRGLVHHSQASTLTNAARTQAQMHTRCTHSTRCQPSSQARAP